MLGWGIAIVIVAGLAIAGGIGWSKLSKEHEEARNLPVEDIDFGQLRDGTYHGAYAGGMYRWRTNECEVKVSSGKVTGIELKASQDPGNKNTQHAMLYERILEAQSLRVDTISGATLTSKAYLKAVENALVQARQS